jgi:hypothetical protein
MSSEVFREHGRCRRLVCDTSRRPSEKNRAGREKRWPSSPATGMHLQVRIVTQSLNADQTAIP